ncbi:MAG: immunoglobulin domain-containing protein, partial [Verrucomicrobia bacterium]|nr:immunoglobulin domain-containing protein [Verrucomicrobiota bacterium]
VGTSASFTVSATGTPTPAYQWRFNGSNLPGATDSTYSIGSVQITHRGAYSVVVTNAVNSIASTSATLTVWVPPAITAQPQDRTVMAGSSTSFSVAASGEPAPGYQWQKAGVAISGANSSSYTIANVRTNDAGYYSVLVTNLAGVLRSSNALLGVQYYRDYTFVNTNLIRIRDWNAAVPYPSVISVAGVDGSLAKVTVRLSRLSHTWVGDVDALVVGPGGQKGIIMSYAGAYSVVEESFVFDDDAADYLPEADWLVGGTYKPTDYPAPGGINGVFFAPAPAGPYVATLTNFIGAPINGPWSLFVQDHALKDLGQIANGWGVGLHVLAVATGSSGTPSPISLEAPTLTSGGLFQFLLRGESGRQYRIESSTNLQTWSAWSTLTATNAATAVSVPASERTRFFRAVNQ